MAITRRSQSLSLVWWASLLAAPDLSTGDEALAQSAAERVDDLRWGVIVEVVPTDAHGVEHLNDSWSALAPGAGDEVLGQAGGHADAAALAGANPGLELGLDGVGVVQGLAQLARIVGRCRMAGMDAEPAAAVGAGAAAGGAATQVPSYAPACRGASVRQPGQAVFMADIMELRSGAEVWG